MTSTLSHDLKRVVAGVLALTLVAGSLPANAGTEWLFGRNGTSITAYAVDSNKGDANGDNTIDVADIAKIVSVMAGGDETPGADANEDGLINVADNAAVIANMAQRSASASTGTKVVLTADDITVANGEEAELVINMDYETTENVVAVAFSLYLPDGILLKGFDTKEAQDAAKASALKKACDLSEDGIWGEDFSSGWLTVKQKDDGGLLFVFIDQDDKTAFESTKSTVITIKVHAVADVSATAAINGISVASDQDASLDKGNIADVTFGINKSAESDVAVTGVTLSPNTAQTIDVGGSVAFTAAVEPGNATDGKVKWSVGGTNADAVKLYTDQACTNEVGTGATSTLTVYAKGISAGTAAVTAASNADSTMSASCNVTVNAVHNHSFTYTAGTGEAANSITAKCEDNCPDGFDSPCTLTLYAPEDLIYDGTAKQASIIGNPGHAGNPSEVVYYKSAGEGSTTPIGEALSGAPADVGSYVAQFTWGDATVSKAFSITGDLFDSAVTVDTGTKSVSVTINGSPVPSGDYTLIFFTYTKIEGGESLTRVGEKYPTEPGTYIATVTAADGSGYTNGQRSEPFNVGTEHDLEDVRQAAGWNSIDVDQDGNSWYIHRAAMLIEDAAAHSGERVMYSSSWDGGSALAPDNWAISPEFVVFENGRLDFWAMCNGSYPENFRVYAIKKSDVDFENFDINAWTPVSDALSATGEWTKYSCDLSDFGGETVYIAFRHKDYDKDYIMIDDITLPGKIVEKKDLFDSTVTIDTDSRTVTVKLGDEAVPAEAYQLNFFTCEETEESQTYNWLGEEFPADPGNYMVTVSAVLGSDYINVNRALFTIEPDTGTFYDFEDFSKLMDWGIPDYDEDGETWGFMDFTGSEDTGTAPHSGVITLGSYSWYDDKSLDPDNWAISPSFVVDEKGTKQLSMWVKGDGSFPDRFRVYVIKKSDADFIDFDPAAWTPVSELTTTSGSWTKHSYDLSDYVGEDIYIAIRHYESPDNYYIMIDDVTLPGTVEAGEHKDLSSAEVTVDTDSETVSVKLDNEEVPEDSYYVVFYSYEKNGEEEITAEVGREFPTEPGAYIAVAYSVFDRGFIKCSASEPFKIYKDFSQADVAVDVDNKTVIVKLGGEVIPSDQYLVTYGPNAPQSFDEFPTAPGTYYAYVTADTSNSDYQGTAVSAAFTITDPKEVRGVRVKLTNVSSDSVGTLNVDWYNDTAVDGYEVLLWNSRRMGHRTSVSKFDVDGSESSITLEDLIPNVRYFVKVRAYNVVDGKRVYSRYSNTDSATVKRAYSGFGFGYGYGYGYGLAPYCSDPWNFGYGMNPFIRSSFWGHGYNYGRPYIAANSYRPMMSPCYFFRF